VKPDREVDSELHEVVFKCKTVKDPEGPYFISGGFKITVPHYTEKPGAAISLAEKIRKTHEIEIDAGQMGWTVTILSQNGEEIGISQDRHLQSAIANAVLMARALL